MLGSGGSNINTATSISMMMGDIWSTGAFSFESPLKDLLDSGNYTLEQLLAEDELLQELRGLHPVLLDFFSNPHVVADLVRHAVVADEEEDDDEPTSSRQEQEGGDPNGGGSTAAAAASPAPSKKKKMAPPSSLASAAAGTFALSDPEFRSIRLPYMACEVMCCELSCVIDTIVDGTMEGEEGDDDEAPPPPSAPGSDGEGDGGAPDTSSNNDASPAASSRHDHQILDSDPDSVEVVNQRTTTSISSSPNDASSSPASGEGVVTPSKEAPAKHPKRILDLLFSIVLNNEVLDDYRAGYFEKILRVLFRRRSDDMVQYVNDRADTLLPALLRHLYSHSILQIVQRLLLPHRPVPKKASPAMDPSLDPDRTRVGASDSDIPIGLVEGIDDDDEDNNHHASMNIIAGEEDESGANIIDDPHAGEVKSDWSRRPEALGMLLDMLLVGRDDDHEQEDAREEDEDNDDDTRRQRRLDMSLNAAEVLITMIQNSLMSSTVMLTLTSSHILERLVVAASTLPVSAATFSPHESTTTAAMSVLESLILQLGGYGAIGTMSMLEDVMMESAELLQQAQPAHLDSYADLYPPPPTRSHAGGQGSQDDPNHPSSTTASSASNSLSPDLVRIADLASLLEHLPLLLDNLSALLRHPDCENWKSCTQFSKDVPVQQLGSARLRIVRVIESLVLLGDPEVDARLVQSDCLEICLNLFWDFQWCSMLHH
jgi:hypothetical protein